MIKHIVMWNLAGETPERNRQACQFLKERFEGLAGLIPGLLKIEVGVDISRIDYACDVVLYTEFASLEALAAYATHPEHLRVRDELGNSRIARHQVDYVV
ncbi:Dabb family protein [Pseudomonas batumici]|uniref:Dabb family protein n=1 Tax=Pseudomonas batumici TaxID=226910 RepID=UPI0030D4583B